jgi:phosphohistidine phosphatase
MDLILWRHAEAEDAPPDLSPGMSAYEQDLARPLTSRGVRQAARMGHWLDRHLPEGVRILVSPARRCEQTVRELGRKYKVRPELAPGASMQELLELVQWPAAKLPVLVVGHQPTLGKTIAQLIGIVDDGLTVKKSAVWWLRSRDEEANGEPAATARPVVLAVRSPELL